MPASVLAELRQLPGNDVLDFCDLCHFRFVLIAVLQDPSGHLFRMAFLFVWSVLVNIVAWAYLLFFIITIRSISVLSARCKWIRGRKEKSSPCKWAETSK